jgi:TonB family protein
MKAATRECAHLLLIAAVSLRCAAADENCTPAPKYPPSLVLSREHGEVDVLVRFGSVGEVASCEVEKTTASKAMQDYTVEFIRKNWHAPKFKGEEEEVPIVYSLRDRVATVVPQGYQRPDPVPRNLEYNIQSGVVVTHCSFDAKGRVVAAIVTQSSGNPQADAYAIAWVKARYYSSGLANMEADVPVSYRHWEKTNRCSP